MMAVLVLDIFLIVIFSIYLIWIWFFDGAKKEYILMQQVTPQIFIWPKGIYNYALFKKAFAVVALTLFIWQLLGDVTHVPIWASRTMFILTIIFIVSILVKGITDKRKYGLPEEQFPKTTIQPRNLFNVKPSTLFWYQTVITIVGSLVIFIFMVLYTSGFVSFFIFNVLLVIFFLVAGAIFFIYFYRKIKKRR